MAKEIRPMMRVNPDTGQEELFYPATTSDAIADPKRRKSQTDINDETAGKLSELENKIGKAVSGESKFTSSENKGAIINVNYTEDTEVFLGLNATQKTLVEVICFEDKWSVLKKYPIKEVIGKYITIPSGTRIIQVISSVAGDGSEILYWSIESRSIGTDIKMLNEDVKSTNIIVENSNVSFCMSRSMLPNIDTFKKTIDFGGTDFYIKTRGLVYSTPLRAIPIIDTSIDSSNQYLIFNTSTNEFYCKHYMHILGVDEVIILNTRTKDNIEFVFDKVWCPFEYTIDGISTQLQIDALIKTEYGTGKFDKSGNTAALIQKVFKDATTIEIDIITSDKPVTHFRYYDEDYKSLGSEPVNEAHIYSVPSGTTRIQVASDKAGTGEEEVSWEMRTGIISNKLALSKNYTDAKIEEKAKDIDDINSNVQSLANSLSFITKSMESINGANTIISSYKFDGNSYYRITVWSESEIICTQFSLFTAIGNKPNTGITKYDGTPIVFENYVSQDTVGNIQVWISNNQSKGTRIYYKVEKLLNDRDYKNAGVKETGTSGFSASAKTSANIYKDFDEDTSVLLEFDTEKTLKEIRCYKLNWELLKNIPFADTINKITTIPKGTQLLQVASTKAGTGEEILKWSIISGQLAYNMLAEKGAEVVKDITPVVERNSDKISALVSSCRLNGLRGLDLALTSLVPKKDIQLLVCTDHHGDNLALSNAVDALNGFDTIDYMILPGDLGGGWYAKSISTEMYNVLEKAKKPYFVAVGNHDVGTSVVIEHCCDHDVAYNDFIKPMIDKGMLTTGEHIGNNCYYYHDFVDAKHNKIRLIVLYEFDDDLAIDETNWRAIPYDESFPLIGNDGTSYNAGAKVRLANFTTYAFQAVNDITLSTTNEWSTTTRPAYKMPRGFRVIRKEQFDWFLDTLASTPEGYGVMVVSHQPLSPNFETQNVMFQNPYINRIGQANCMEDYIAEAVNAYSNRSNFNKTINVSAQMKHEGFSYNVAKDFTNAKGSFICYVGGHLHFDGVFKHKTYNQYAIHPTAARAWGYGATDYGEDIAHSNVDDVAYDCLTVMSPNTDRIALVKIGATKTIDGKTRDFEVIKL